MSDLAQKHPQYTDSVSDWTLMRDCHKGERHIKSRGPVYLPPTSAHIMDGYGTANMESIGWKAYNAYRQRARFPNFVREAIETAIGMMHSQPAEIELPKAMEKIRSVKGETPQQLLRRINLEQLLTGRVGLMADLPTSTKPGEDMPYLAVYSAEKIINWDDGQSNLLVPQHLNLVVLDESEQVRKDVFHWHSQTKYRVLVMGNDAENEEKGIYRQGVFGDKSAYSESGLNTPSWRGRTLERIPFIIINACDVTPDVDDPPLLDLGNLCLTIYRTDADYRHNLYMQGQDTFVTMGGNFDETDRVRTGAGARIDLPMGGKAEYVGVKSTGLSEQREALSRLEARAGSIGAQTLDTTSRERESGESLRIRVAARTADMNQIVETGANGLEAMLRVCAEWMGEDPEKVKVKPNKEFGEIPLTGQAMVEIATAAANGFPISKKSMHALGVKRRVTSMTYEEEMAQIAKEPKPEVPGEGKTPGNPDPNDKPKPKQEDPKE